MVIQMGRVSYYQIHKYLHSECKTALTKWKKTSISFELGSFEFVTFIGEKK